MAHTAAAPEGTDARRASWTTADVRKWALRLTLVALGFLAPLVALEVAVRLFGPFLPGNYNTGTFLTPHPVYGRFHVPGFDGWVKTAEFTSRVRINSLGLRGPERPYEKPVGVTRVLVLGDSLVEAAQVPEQDGLVARIEATLNQAEPGRYEVLNGGVGGWGTGQQYVFLTHEGHRYRPDLVIVALFLGNDVYDNSYVLQGRPRNPHEPYFVFERDGSLRQLEFRMRKPERTNWATATLRSGSQLWNVFETGVLDKLDDSGDPEELRLNRFNLNKMLVHANTPNDRLNDAWRVTLSLLERIYSAGQEHGFATAVVAVPASWQVHQADWDDLLLTNNLRRSEWSADRPNHFLAQRRPEIKPPVLDLLPAFRAEAERSPARLYFPADKHWTSDGHALAAREMSAFLVAQGLLSGVQCAPCPVLLGASQP